MAGSPVISLAARILRQVADGTPADLALREGLKRTRHRSAPAERREVSHAVFTYFRWRRWLDSDQSAAGQLEAALALQARFDRDPVTFKPEALAARAIPDWLRGEIPWPELDDSASTQPGTKPGLSSAGPKANAAPTATETAWLRQLQRPPALWIRPKAGLEQKIAAALGHCVPATLPQFANHIPSLSAFRYTGSGDLFYSEGFQAGDFEIQDLASQLVGHACSPRAGEIWWDACAGEGGKTLHLADLMQYKGLLWASDRSARRLARLKERAARAKVFNYRSALWEGGTRLPTKAKFDGVLVDAPCSGIGTWQRNPHARWTTQLQDVHELTAVQTQLLDRVAGSLKPGGRLIYSVCTLTRSETVEVVRRFSAGHPDFVPSPVWPGPSTPGGPAAEFLWPQQLNANGMFLACWRKKA